MKGPMMKFFAAALFLVASLVTGSAYGQSLPAATAGLQLDAEAGFTALHATAGPAQCGCFFTYGGNGQLALTSASGIGLVFDFARTSSSTTNGFGHNLTLYTFQEGVRYTVNRGGKYVPFGQALIGIAHTASNYRIDEDQTKLAFGGGGGLDVRFSHRFEFRPIEAEYVRTSIPNGQNNRQNQFRFSAGIVYHLTANDR